MVKDCEKFKKKRKKMPIKANPHRKKFIPNVGLVARLTNRKKDVGKGQVHTSNPSAPDQRTRRTMILTLKP